MSILLFAGDPPIVHPFVAFPAAPLLYLPGSKLSELPLTTFDEVPVAYTVLSIVLLLGVEGVVPPEIYDERVEVKEQ